MLTADYVTIVPMDEGRRITDLLDQAEKSPSDLARACHITRQAIVKQLKEKKLGKKAWFTIRRGLEALHIDPAQVRSWESEKDPHEDLCSLVASWPLDHLSALKRIMDAHPDALRVLMAFVDGRLHQQ
jgi:hypothetical protein